MTTVSHAILINSVNPILSTDTFSIGDVQTSGVLNIGTNTGIINIGSTTNLAPINIETRSVLNSFGTPAIAIPTNNIGMLKMGNITTTTYLSDIVIYGDEINPLDPSNDLGLTVLQTTGNLTIGSAASRTGDINIATGDGSSCNVNIRNGNNSTATVGIANGAQTTTVNIQSGTGTGTVTIGNSANAIALNGAVTLARPLVLGSLPTSGQLGWRTENLMTNPTTPFTTGTSSVPLTARSFTFPISGLLFVELRLQATTASASVVASITQTTNSLTINSEKTVALANPTGSVTTLSLTTTLTAGGTWYVTVRSAATNTTFNNFYLYATRIG